MRSSKFFLLLNAAITFLFAATTTAGGVDMKDPRRAVALEDNLRIDAQLVQDTIGSGGQVNVTYQIENLARVPVALADRLADTSYDPESRTVTFTVGSEIPDGKIVPHLTVIMPGEKKIFTSTANVHVVLPATRSPFIAYPRYVQVKVNVLRDLTPFDAVLKQQQTSAAAPLSDAVFETWVENNDAIFLNAVPVRWKSGRSPSEQAGADVATPVALAAGGTF
jgi:hypothetical protein